MTPPHETSKQDLAAGELVPDEETLPTFSEQVASQLGGVRGMVESSIPVLAFVLTNVVWSLTPAVIVAVCLALGIAGYRLARRESVRYAINGLFGIAIGAALAFKTGDPKTFYAPGILLTFAYGLALIASVVARRPLVGWLWSLVADNGAERWRLDQGLRRIFGWLTVIWATTFMTKFVVNVLVPIPLVVRAPRFSQSNTRVPDGLMR